MNLANLLSIYASLNILIAVAYVSLKAFAFIQQGESAKLPARTLLNLHTLALLLVFAVPAASLVLPKQPFFQPPAKIWSASSLKSFSRDKEETGEGVLLLPTLQGSSSVETVHVTAAGLAMIAALLFAGLFLLLRDVRLLFRIRRSAFQVRHIGRVQILVSDEASVPFSYRSALHANVVMPSYLLTKPVDYRIAIQHELQHHRQGDTKSVYAFWLLRLTCVANPFVHLWARELSEIQEFACDEALVDLKKVDSHAYARCLFEVAETANGLKGYPVCATGLTFQTRGHLLKRRINTMLLPKTKQTKRSYAIASLVALTTVMTLSAFSSAGLVQDRRVTPQMAQTLAIKTQSKTDFPIVINDRVLRQLNRYIGTPEGREFMRDALVRMDAERAPIEKAMKDYGVPQDLLAMPIIESGYENLPQSKSKSAAKGAGLWQFIPQTARDYGLRVTSKVDERLDKALLTDAAMRLLVANKLRFGSWMLSVSAYNAGEERVQEGIDKTGSRDAWVLIGKGFEGDQDYLAKLMAAILIMNNPDSVQ